MVREGAPISDFKRRFSRNQTISQFLAWDFTPVSHEGRLQYLWHGIGTVGAEPSKSVCGLSILAASPTEFKRSQDVISWKSAYGPFAMTNQGLQITVPLLKSAGNDPGYFGLLGCSIVGNVEKLVRLYLHPRDSTQTRFVRCHFSKGGATELCGIDDAILAVPRKITIVDPRQFNETDMARRLSLDTPRLTPYVIVRGSQLLAQHSLWLEFSLFFLYRLSGMFRKKVVSRK
jgi:hypothetical protein